MRRGGRAWRALAAGVIIGAALLGIAPTAHATCGIDQGPSDDQLAEQALLAVGERALMRGVRQPSQSEIRRMLELRDALSEQMRTANFTAALPLARESNDLAIRLVGPNHPSALSNSIGYAQLLGSAGQLSEALRVAQSTARRSTSLLGEGAPLTGRAWLAVAQFQYQSELYRDAALSAGYAVTGLQNWQSRYPSYVMVAIALRAISNAEGNDPQATLIAAQQLKALCEQTYGPDTPNAVFAIGLVASSAIRLRQFDDARVAERSLKTRGAMLTAFTPGYSFALTRIAAAYARIGLATEAETAATFALAYLQRHGQGQSQATISLLAQLAEQMRRIGNFVLAEQFSTQAITILEQGDLSQSGDSWALLMLAKAIAIEFQNRRPEAVTLYRIILSPNANARPIGSIKPATRVITQIYLSDALRHMGQCAQAEREIVAAMRQPGFGLLDADSAVNANVLLGEAYVCQGKYEDAIALLERQRRIMSAETPSGSYVFNVLIQARLGAQQTAPARTLAEEVIGLTQRRGIEVQDQRARALQSDYLAQLTQLWLQATYRQSGNRPSPTDIELAFERVQTGQATAISDASVRAAVRASAGDADLQKRLLAYDQALADRRAELAIATRAANDSSEDGKAALLAASQRADAAGAAVQAELAGISREHPRYFDLLRPRPVTLAQLQGRAGDAALLRDDEAVIVITAGNPNAHEGLRRGSIIVATRADSAWAHIDIEPDQLRAEVTAMRAELDAAGATRSASTPNANGFNRARAKRLYDVLFGAPAIQAVIADKPRWLLSVDGVLLSLPFAALVTETPMDGASGDADPESLRTTRWLGAKHTLSVLPGVSHLRTARAAKAQQAVASDPLFAVGDPAFTGAADATRTIGPSGNFFRAGAADVEAVRNLPRLIGTLIEVVNVRALLKAPAAAALLGHDATEAHVRARADAMARARVVLFATHGLVAGDFGLSEPALALTPPPLSVDMPVDPNNDGLLTASEIAFLPLRADWVILSACNTASGAAGAEGLSGLARAFFYAGAKSLLVSHWRVRDETAADLTTAAVTIANEGRSRADAVREAMARIRDDRSRDASGAALSHPAAWAPFAYVGVD